ncbi:FxLD family lanthipeptide [Streptomyces bobili]|uniref:FxLD family lanthipeptide n=1 Tax=Streptomyces bobili TaxID=67280 RepID=UPI00371DD0B1
MEIDEFDLDISVLESGNGQATLINFTDDGCGSTCSSPCATNVACPPARRSASPRGPSTVRAGTSDTAARRPR